MPEKMGIEGKIILHLDEYEAVRLSDYLRLSHSEAAERMGVSRSTFTRLIGGAHRKIHSWRKCSFSEGYTSL